jgi:hypothetical protein
MRYKLIYASFYDAKAIHCWYYTVKFWNGTCYSTVNSHQVFAYRCLHLLTVQRKTSIFFFIHLKVSITAFMLVLCKMYNYCYNVFYYLILLDYIKPCWNKYFLWNTFVSVNIYHVETTSRITFQGTATIPPTPDHPCMQFVLTLW